MVIWLLDRNWLVLFVGVMDMFLMVRFMLMVLLILVVRVFRF